MVIAQNRAYVQRAIALFLMYLNAPIAAIAESKSYPFFGSLPSASGTFETLNRNIDSFRPVPTFILPGAPITYESIPETWVTVLA
ncbi:MAG: hypothetical protein IIA06_13345 [Proteobacteria bacterium]|nr:hypothetical protein [Pseudomonadota bacterium]